MKRSSIRPMVRAVVACVLGAGLVVGIAPSIAAAAPVLEPFEVSAAGVTVGIPDKWLSFDLAEGDLAEIEPALEKAGAKDPRALAEILSTLVPQGGVLYAVEAKQRGGINQNLNVVRGPVLDRTLSDFDRDLRTPFRNLKAKAPKINPVQIDGVDARQISGRVRIGESSVLLRQVITVVGDEFLTFTFSLKSGLAGKELADALVESIVLDD